MEVRSGPGEAGTARPMSTVQRSEVVSSRATALLFSFFSFITMVTLANYNAYEEFIYVLVVAIITMVYTAVQTLLKVLQVCTKKEIIPRKYALLVHFIGDQIVAYLLISSASAGTPSLVRLRKQYSGRSIKQLTTTIVTSYLACFSMACAALISGSSLFRSTTV